MASDEKTKDSSLVDSIDSLKEMLRDNQDLSDTEFAPKGRADDEVLTTQDRPRDHNAIASARRNLGLDPSNPNLKDWLAFNLYANNEVDEAILLYEELIETGHKNSDQYYYLGNAYFKRGNFEQALNAWRMVCDLATGTRRAAKAFERIRKLRRQMLNLNSL